MRVNLNPSDFPNKLENILPDRFIYQHATADDHFSRHLPFGRLKWFGRHQSGKFAGKIEVWSANISSHQIQIGAIAMKFNQFYSRFFCALAMCCLLTGCEVNFRSFDGYSFDFTGSKKEKHETGKLDDGIKRIEVENRFGDLKLVPATDDETGWSWDATCWADSDEMAQTQLDDMFLDIETIGETQSWKLVMPESSRDLNGVKSDLTIRVPAGLQVKLLNAHGNLEAVGIDSDLTAENSHGDISLSELTGKGAVKLSHGNFTATKITDLKLTVNHGNSKIESATGAVLFDGSHGDFVASHVDGDLTIQASHTGIEVDHLSKSAKLQTTHNSIVASELLGNVEIENSHGEIRVSDSSGNLKTTNHHGATKIAAAGESITVWSEFGRVEIAVIGSDFQTIRAETTHSDLVLTLPESTEANLAIDISHGAEKSDLASVANSPRRISLKNSFGDIEIKKQSAAE